MESELLISLKVKRLLTGATKSFDLIEGNTAMQWSKLSAIKPHINKLIWLS